MLGGLPVQDTTPIRVVLQGEQRLRHDFRGGGRLAHLCLAIKNCSDSPLFLCVETTPGVQHPSGDHQPSRGQNPNVPDFALVATGVASGACFGSTHHCLKVPLVHLHVVFGPPFSVSHY